MKKSNHGLHLAITPFSLLISFLDTDFLDSDLRDTDFRDTDFLELLRLSFISFRVNIAIFFSVLASIIRILITKDSSFFYGLFFGSAILFFDTYIACGATFIFFLNISMYYFSRFGLKF
jgi:hypothetical protein